MEFFTVSPVEGLQGSGCTKRSWNPATGTKTQHTSLSMEAVHQHSQGNFIHGEQKALQSVNGCTCNRIIPPHSPASSVSPLMHISYNMPAESLTRLIDLNSMVHSPSSGQPSSDSLFFTSQFYAADGTPLDPLLMSPIGQLQTRNSLLDSTPDFSALIHSVSHSPHAPPPSLMPANLVSIEQLLASPLPSGSHEYQIPSISHEYHIPTQSTPTSPLLLDATRCSETRSCSPKQEPQERRSFSSSASPAPTSSSKSGRRLRINHDELSYLIDQFRKDPSPSTAQLTVFARHLKMDVMKVRIWFQNRRARSKSQRRESF